MGDLFNLEPKSAPAGPVECLGMTFPNDEERRKHFLGILREKLKDPEFRKIEGFPIGSDEDILALVMTVLAIGVALVGAAGVAATFAEHADRGAQHPRR